MRREFHRAAPRPSLSILLTAMILASSAGLLTASLAAAAPRLLADLETAPGSQQSFPFPYWQAGGLTYFTMEAPGQGIELWRTDGTPVGTWLLRDINPGGQSPQIRGAVAVGNRLVFAAQTRGLGQELWATDGSREGTGLLKDICPGNCWGVAEVYAVAGGQLFFLAQDPNLGLGLWVSDGTRAGTRPVGADLVPESDHERIVSTAALGDRLALVVQIPQGPTGPPGPSGFSHQLHLSDGTAAGTRLVADLGESFATLVPESVEALGGRILISRSGPGSTSLWISDGTAAGTGPAAELPTEEGFQLVPQGFFDLDGQLLAFLSKSPTNDFTSVDCEIWTTDGTTAGTSRRVRLTDLADFDPVGGSISCPFDMAAIGGRLFFAFFASGPDLEFWSTDGTAAGTRSAAGLLERVDGILPRQLTALDGNLWFLVRDDSFDSRLVRSDGTTAGTRVYDPLARVQTIFPLGGGLLAVGRRNGGPFSAWAVGGIGEAPVLVLELPERPASSGPTDLIRIGERMLFVARTEETGSELWSSNGTAAGTEVLDLNPGTSSTSPTVLRRFGQRIYFHDFFFLWRSDGTAAGTRRLTDSVFNGEGVPLGGFVYLGREGEEGRELWRTDGTPEGTTLVKDIFPGSSPDPEYPDEEIANSSFPFSFNLVGEKIVFVADDGVHGEELWVTDGTTAGTRMLADLNPGAVGSFVSAFSVLGDRLFFVFENQLWVTDGSPAGTRELTRNSQPVPGGISALTPFKGRIFALENRSDDFLNPRYSLLVSDGTVEGTERIFDFPPSLRISSGFIAAGSRLFFTAHHPETGEELWATDGTAAGAFLVKDILPGLESSEPSNLRAVDGVLLFAATGDPLEGHELWRSDGTAEGTVPLGEIEPGVGSSLPGSFTPVGDQILFSAFRSDIGRELWAIDRDEIRTACAPGPGRLCLGGGRYEVVVDWRNPRTGVRGTGSSAEFSGDTGFFTFFNEQNVELLVKMLDGRQRNGRYWFFSGALSDVEYWITVTDLETGRVETFHNPPFNLCGRGETRVFDDRDVTLSDPPFISESTAPPAHPDGPAAVIGRETTCDVGNNALRLRDGRFAAEVSWRNQRTGATGIGLPVPGTDQSGYFWFFNPDNLELVVKMLDGTANNGHYWFFFGGLSDVEYEIKVTDTATCQEKIYRNPPGEICGQADILAFEEGFVPF